MCGIAGIFNLDGAPVAISQLQRMADLLHHRGPDDEGYALFNTSTGEAFHFCGPDSPPGVKLPDIRSAKSLKANLGLAERRLAILDLSPAGHTPMTTPDGRLTICFNGEVYNYVELRAELKSLGYTFSSTGDTEVILAAYRQWGTGCVERFNGMWAFAIWDAHQRILFCSRDRFGVKPFYYTKTATQFAFASEPKALWASGVVAVDLDEALLEDFLAGYESSRLDGTMFRHIQQLPGGHLLVVSEDRFEVRRFWSLPVNPDLGPEQPEAEPARRTLELLRDAVRLRLRSDVPVGTCLSGGLDSSSIVVLVNQLMQQEHDIPRAQIGEHQKTFTAAYDDLVADERRFAQLVVQQTGAAWHVTFPTADTLQADLEAFIWHHDEPPISTSLYAQWCVMRLVREQGVTVVLDGQGSDELLAGYLPFDIYLSQILSTHDWSRFWRELREVARVNSRPIREVLMRMLALRLPEGARRRVQTLRRARMLGLKPDVAARATRRHQELFDANRSNLPLHLADLAAYNLPRLLRAEDRSSMAFSVEARTPFLDFRFAEYVSQLPAVYRIHKGWTKYVLRQAMSQLLPEAVVWRRDKKGFTTPEAGWVEALKPAGLALFADKPRSEPWLDLHLVRKVLSSQQPLNSQQAATVWRWIAAEQWLRLTEKQRS
ncbi:MAG: asparagine synthase (glutamine-hydrolyzing) [Anaerolineae bacterium]|nr:asparagine synthase (glutamine-hydrolyzing) [Anaerolineae bacterium]